MPGLLRGGSRTPSGHPIFQDLKVLGGPSLPLTEDGPGKMVVRQKECPGGSLEQAT